MIVFAAMDRRLHRLAPAVYRAYACVFVVLGGLGIVGAHLELDLLYGLRLLPEQREAGTSLLNQLRFLRAIELGFGLLMLRSTEAFFGSVGRRSDLNVAVLAALAAIPASRTISLLLDGPPRSWMTATLVAEWALFLWLRRASEPKRTQGSVETTDRRDEPTGGLPGPD